MDDNLNSSTLQEPPANVSPNIPLQEQPPTAGGNKKKIGIIAGICVLVVAAGVGGYFALNSSQKTTDKQQETYAIGLMLPFTKDADLWGAAGLKGAELAKTQLGADNIQFIKEDTQCDETLTPAAVDRLAAKKVIAIIGETCSGASLAALTQANKHKIVMISASSSSPKLTVADDYFFRVIPPDEYQGAFTANRMYDAGIRKVAVMYATETYGTSLSEIFKTKFEDRGGTVVSSVNFENDAINFPNQMAAIKASNPDAVYFVTNSLSSGRAAIKEMKSSGIKVPIFASDGIYDKALISDGDDSAEGLTLTVFSTGNPAFNKALQQDYAIGDSPGTYDAVKAVYLAIQKGAKTSEELKNILPTIDFDGVSGHIKFDKNGDVSENYKYTVLQVKDRKFVVVN
jgi:branched-chain amino acid transport system substrate-binding protein